MNLSSDVATYVPLEYQEACAPLSAEENLAERPSEASSVAASAAEQRPDPAELFAEQLEQERLIITHQAHQEAEREIARTRAAVADAIKQFARQRDEYFHQAEGEIVNLALAIARHVIHRESQIDPQLLAGLVRHELEQMEAATSVRLVVSPETLHYWNEALRAIPRPAELVVDKSVDAGAARIETALGSTTVGFELELKEIERGFFDLLSRRPPATPVKAVRVQ